jgi:hypothetical protein
VPRFRTFRRPPSLAAFALASALLHVGAFATVRARAPSGPAFEPASPMLTGDMLDVEPEAEEPGAEEATEAPELAAQAAPPVTPGPTTDPPRMRTSSATRASSLPNAATAPTAGGARPGLFGAVGVRYASDLATTFTRGFPQAASADPVWATVAFGSAGTADVFLTLDDAGHLQSSSISGAPSPALRRGVERTLALLGARAFTARGATTRLRLVARVGRDDVHDGLHGDVFALSGGSFSGDVGTAFFALPASGGPGRRIDVELRLVP